jgi:hypothetical protein
VPGAPAGDGPQHLTPNIQDGRQFTNAGLEQFPAIAEKLKA